MSVLLAFNDSGLLCCQSQRWAWTIGWGWIWTYTYIKKRKKLQLPVTTLRRCYMCCAQIYNTWSRDQNIIETSWWVFIAWQYMLLLMKTKLVKGMHLSNINNVQTFFFSTSIGRKSYLVYFDLILHTLFSLLGCKYIFILYYIILPSLLCVSYIFYILHSL